MNPGHAVVVCSTLASLLLGCSPPPVPEARFARGPALLDPPRQADLALASPRLAWDGSSVCAVDGALAAVARTRGLSPLRAVRCARVPRATLLALMREHVAREVPAAAIRAEGTSQKLLGLFPTAEDYEATTYALFAGQLAGFYEPANGTMYLAADLDDTEARATLSHELVHALEDQRWNLGQRSAYVPGEDDRSSAEQALAEGDATVAEELAQARGAGGEATLDLPDDELARALAATMRAGEPPGTPRGLERAILAPYVDGALFVQSLRRVGGWGAVDAAWTSPPATTEQLLHPEKWRAREPAIPVPAPPVPEGFMLIEANTYGEQGLRLALEEWSTPAIARAAASGWGGDRVALFGRDDGAVGLVWHVRFDDAPREAGATDAFARRAFSAIAGGAPRLGQVAARPDSVCVDRPANGVLEVIRDGRDLFIAVGAVLPRAEGWRALGACDTARAWIDAARAPNGA